MTAPDRAGVVGVLEAERARAERALVRVTRRGKCGLVDALPRVIDALTAAIEWHRALRQIAETEIDIDDIHGIVRAALRPLPAPPPTGDAR